MPPPETIKIKATNWAELDYLESNDSMLISWPSSFYFNKLQIKADDAPLLAQSLLQMWRELEQRRRLEDDNDDNS